jgi:hypothetical protein
MLAGCLTTQPPLPREVVVSSKPVEKPQLNLPPVDELNLRQVDWIIVTEENIDRRIEELKGSGQPLAMFVLTGEGYENLGLNFSDIRALVQQQQSIIVAYENYYGKEGDY